jgi:hypothetical protein
VRREERPTQKQGARCDAGGSARRRELGAIWAEGAGGVVTSLGRWGEERSARSHGDGQRRAP